MDVEPRDAVHLKLDIFRAILVSQGIRPAPTAAAALANGVYKALYGETRKRAKKR